VPSLILSGPRQVCAAAPRRTPTPESKNFASGSTERASARGRRNMNASPRAVKIKALNTTNSLHHYISFSSM
jgi:hypothetical protein